MTTPVSTVALYSANRTRWPKIVACFSQMAVFTSFMSAVSKSTPHALCSLSNKTAISLSLAATGVKRWFRRQICENLSEMNLCSPYTTNSSKWISKRGVWTWLRVPLAKPPLRLSQNRSQIMTRGTKKGKKFQKRWLNIWRSIECVAELARTISA